VSLYPSSFRQFEGIVAQVFSNLKDVPHFSLSKNGRTSRLQLCKIVRDDVWVLEFPGEFEALIFLFLCDPPLPLANSVMSYSDYWVCFVFLPTPVSPIRLPSGGIWSESVGRPPTLFFFFRRKRRKDLPKPPLHAFHISSSPPPFFVSQDLRSMTPGLATPKEGQRRAAPTSSLIGPPSCGFPTLLL